MWSVKLRVSNVECGGWRVGVRNVKCRLRGVEFAEREVCKLHVEGANGVESVPGVCRVSNEKIHCREHEVQLLEGGVLEMLECVECEM